MNRFRVIGFALALAATEAAPPPAAAQTLSAQDQAEVARIEAYKHWLIVEDCKTSQPQHLPLHSTPAGLLIQDRIALSGEFRVSEVKREPPWLAVRIVETKSPEKGAMSLAFRVNPLQLIGWTVIDQIGGVTQVSLENIQAGIPLDPSLFVFISQCDEKDRNRLGR